MTTAKKDPRALSATPIRFRSFAEINSRPKWRDGLDAHQHKLLRIIGDYSFSKKDEVQCGLKSCRSPHMHGYVVETLDGLETHIGNRCGKNHFGVNWGEIRSIFNRATEDRDRQEWLETVLAEKETLMTKAKSLLASVTEATQQIDAILERLRKEPEIHGSFVRAVRNHGAIQVEQSIDEDTARAMNLPAKQRHMLATVGRIAGTAALPATSNTLPGNQIASKLRASAIPAFTQLSASALKNLNPRQRKDRTKDIESAKLILKDAEAYIANARMFLRPANLRELGKLPVNRANQRTERILKQFASTPD